MRASLRSVVLSFLLCNVLWVAGTSAQERRGTITGRVMDASQGVLQGARVELQPGGITAVSDGHGEFTITNVSAGKYTQNQSYVGVDTFSTERKRPRKSAQ